ncbi:alpha-ribazole phosphatase [Mannheimia haemolytica]|uniref:Alpha-ribazole phosphatase n=1 Tax=Mannheimia haemolytica TaxID=75985 RepID=A0A378NEB9_MANHA|nr:alpha-ribazole phosphatase [Mannheimia haemolytica]
MGDETYTGRISGKANGGERFEQLYQRVTQAFNQIAELHQNDGKVLIVSHGMTLTLLTAVLKALRGKISAMKKNIALCSILPLRK